MAQLTTTPNLTQVPYMTWDALAIIKNRGAIEEIAHHLLALLLIFGAQAILPPFTSILPSFAPFCLHFTSILPPD